MVVKILTHVHLLVYTLWCWHTLKRRWSLKGRERMGLKCIFSIAPVGNFGEVAGLFLAEKHSPDAGPEAPDAVSVCPV